MNKKNVLNPADWLFSGVFDGDQQWRSLRFILTIMGMLVFAWVASLWINFSGWQWLWLLIPLSTALAGALLQTARFSQDIFDLPSVWRVLAYLVTSLFFLPTWNPFRWLKYPEVIIDAGEKQKLSEHESKILGEIGGPASVYIRPGNAIVVGYPWKPDEVFDIGWHLIGRFGKIKAIVDLREQECQCPTFSANSKDGIAVDVKDAHFRYRVYRAPEEPRRTRTRPYPYAVDAVRKIAGSSTPQKWQEAVLEQFKSVITEFITQHRFDYITNFTDADARKELRELMETNGRNKFREKGAELILFDLGSLDYKDIIKQQYFNKWQSEWVGNAKVEHAYGEARMIAYEELGRAEGQAEMLMSIVHALDSIDLSDNPQQRRKNVRSLILIRTAQILEGLAIENKTNEMNKDGLVNPKKLPAE
jgi:hypothetical protein